MLQKIAMNVRYKPFWLHVAHSPIFATFQYSTLLNLFFLDFVVLGRDFFIGSDFTVVMS